MKSLALLVMALTASCSLGMRQPAHSHPFCEGGHLVLPGQYVGAVAIPIRRGEPPIVRPLIAGDTVCLRRPPAPPPRVASMPQFPDSTKP